MLIEFSVENFRSIRDRITLSLIKAKLRASQPEIDHNNVIPVNEKLSLLRSVVLYGANASGKSNVIKAMSFMRGFVMTSARQQDEDSIRAEPFRLSKTTIDQPSTFEVVFLLDGRQYRYGFSVTEKRVVEEWLYFTPTIREVALFTRDEDGIHIGDRFKEGQGLKELSLENKLFLSVVAQFRKDGIASRVRNWFNTACRVINASENENFLDYTKHCIEKGQYLPQIEEFVRRFDLDITGLSVREVPLPEPIARLYDRFEAAQIEVAGNGNQAKLSLSGATMDRAVKELRSAHDIRDETGKRVETVDFAAQEMESEGTQKLIALIGPLIDVLSRGSVLFVDEIDARLHPLITAAIIGLFHSPETNPKNAQLICVTHDTNLLDGSRFRRDQIYFVEKDRTSSSRLYSLAEFKLRTSEGEPKTIRNNDLYEKNYIQGRYGAIPFLGDFDGLFGDEFRQEEPQMVNGSEAKKGRGIEAGRK